MRCHRLHRLLRQAGHCQKQRLKEASFPLVQLQEQLEDLPRASFPPVQLQELWEDLRRARLRRGRQERPPRLDRRTVRSRVVLLRKVRFHFFFH